MRRRDISKALLATAAGPALVRQGAQAQTCNAPCYVQTTAESAALVTPVNYAYPPGHLYRYGTNTNPGITDMTRAVQNWAKVGGTLFMPVPDTVLILNTIPFRSNSTITLCDGVKFVCPTADISIFQVVSGSNVSFSGGVIQQTAAQTAAHIGVVDLTGCTNCTVENVEVIGAQWAGILINQSTYCEVRGCFIHDSLGTGLNQDTSDILVYQTSQFNLIEQNLCYGGAPAVEHGIMLLGPGGGQIPSRNTVYGNRVGPHRSYGIVHYLVDHANTYTSIQNNEIEGITGTGQGGAAGSGIYNQGAGGTVIANNTVRRCCINTTNRFTLIPAGIALNLDVTMLPVNCIGNHVSDIVNGNACISISGGPANIEGNVLIQSAGMNTNLGINLDTASNVKVSGNHITIDPGIAVSYGVISLTGANVSNISITSNHILGCSAAHIRVDTTAVFTTSTVSVSGNTTSSISANCVPLRLDHVNNAAITGNSFGTAGNTVMTANTSMQCMYTGNVFAGAAGAPAVIFTGPCNGSYFDKSNMLGTFVDNQATGMATELSRVAPPPAAYHSGVGDRIEQQVPIVGSPKGWRCTVAGSPGTWVSEGNL